MRVANFLTRVGPLAVVNHRLQTQLTPPAKSPSSSTWTTGTPVVEVMLVARQRASQLRRADKPMKANTTTNLASIVMLVIVSPFLALAVLVSIKTTGIRNNEYLLVLLTLSSAVLSGINGFGRRTATAVQLASAKAEVRGAQSSRVSVTFAGSPSNNA